MSTVLYAQPTTALRDHLAGLAMQIIRQESVSEEEISTALGITSAEYDWKLHYCDGIAALAYQQADAMIRARSKA